ncbi:hypothetical protein PV10_06721 [Exophiala mesophila]|uniref:Uncharacterized protein n=1 Tax=Exophiala mesophila TaxID=212818 RepID=A0A0D1ZE84_EXOME|nr:uncharacterized protein PV10_06721 [Exophiala mesophila]KIV92264.1 hypothetical protein PV10_06721 [Exophiala mesophila]
MSRSTRISTPGRDENAKEVTAIMNDLAESKTNTPSKRKVGAEDPRVLPNATPKRRVTLQLTSAPNTVSPRRSSSRLRSRVSLPVVTPVFRADQVQIPVEEHDTRPRMEPIKKLRPLNKQKETTDSPFKGYGVLDPKGNARVNLDDSPANNTRGRWLGKISQSLQKTRNTSGKPIKTLKRVKGQGRNLPTRLVRNSIMEEDPIEAAAREQDEPLTPGLGSTLVDGKATAGALSRSNRFSPLKADTRRGKSKKADLSHLVDSEQINHLEKESRDDDADEPSNTYNEEGEGNRAPQSIIQLAEQTTKVPSPSKAIAQDIGDEDGVEIATPDAGVSHPETARDRRTRIQAEKEKIERARILQERALKGVKEAVKYHGLAVPWTELLTAMLEIERSRSTSSPTSIQGRGAHRPLAELFSHYRDLARDEPADPATAAESIGNNLRMLKERIEHGRELQLRAEVRTRMEREELGEDMYQHILPGTIRLAKMILKARFRDEQLGFHAHKEIMRVLDLIQNVVSICREWTPRPSLEEGIKALTRTTIRKSVHSLIVTYEYALTERHREIYLREFNARRAAELQEWNMTLARKRAEITQRHQASQFNPQPSRILHTEPLVVMQKDWPQHPRDQVLDIDDIVIAPQGDVRTLSAPIPDLEPEEWSEEETVALVNALQQYTSPRTRFHDIMADQGCAPYGVLARFDINDLVARAKWIKASMRTQLEGCAHEAPLGSDFDFLRSVPG